MWKGRSILLHIKKQSALKGADTDMTEHIYVSDDLFGRAGSKSYGRGSLFLMSKSSAPRPAPRSSLSQSHLHPSVELTFHAVRSHPMSCERLDVLSQSHMASLDTVSSPNTGVGQEQVQHVMCLLQRAWGQIPTSA